MALARKKLDMPEKSGALPGRSTPLKVHEAHFVNGHRTVPPFPAGMREALFGLGCFWGAERLFWELPGVYSTAVGYAGGFTPNPTYEEVCTGETGHAEVVRVIYDPKKIGYEQLLKAFWESHDPTQGMRQGNDIGTQYRSVIFFHDPEQQRIAREVIEEARRAWGREVVTQLEPAPAYYRAEDYHQEYFRRNPDQGYCMAVIGPKVEKFRKTFARKRRAPAH